MCDDGERTTDHIIGGGGIGEAYTSVKRIGVLTILNMDVRADSPAEGTQPNRDKYSDC